jgi:hypothetical protein
MITSFSFLLRIRNVLDKFVEKITTHILGSIIYIYIYFLETLVFNEITWKNIYARTVTHDKMVHDHCMLEN